MKVDMKKFSGVHVAMNSCYDSLGRFNSQAARRLTRFLIDRGIMGLYVGGGTGEGVLQTTEERKRMLEAVIEENNGQVTITAHIGAITTEDSVELAKHADSAGANAISAIAPFYFSYTNEETKSYWTNIMNASPLPFIAYHVPSATGFNISSDFFKEMLTIGTFLGVKITTFSTYELQQMRAAAGEDFIIFNGPDQQYLAGRVMGANGGIGSTYGVMPELYLRIESAYVSGNIPEAQKWQTIVNAIITEMRMLGLMGVIKQLIKMRGIDCGVPRSPLKAVSASDYDRVSSLFDRIMNYVESESVSLE